MLTAKKNVIIILIIFIVAVKYQTNAEKFPKYSDQIHVYPILYPPDPSELQLKINWQKTNLKDETINIDVKPLDDGLYCQGLTCYEYGVFPNISEIALPKHPSPMVEYHECPIRPACHYNIRVVSSNNTISVDFTYVVPDCVENICSCAHQNAIPSVVLVAKIEEPLNTVLLEWSIPASTKLPKSVHYENITIEVSKHQVTTLTWGGPLELLATSVITLHQKGKFIQNSSEILHLAESLASGERLDVSARIIDNRGCAGPMSKTVANVPELPLVETRQRTSPKAELWLLQFILPPVIIIIVVILGAPRIYRRFIKKNEVANWRGVYRTVTHSSMANVIMEDNVLYTDKDILEARARGEADYLEIPHSCLHLGSEIGKGAFGRVLFARADNLFGRPGQQDVAVKQLKRRPTNSELDEFLDEIATLKKVGKHPNIVNLLGCCTIKQPLLMVMEYVGCGDLLQYLRTLREKHEKKIASITGEIRSLENFSRNSNSLSSQCIHGKYIDILHSSNSNTTTSEGSYITQPDTQPSHPSQLRPSVTETTYTIVSENESSAVRRNPLEYVLNHNELHSFAVQIARGMKHLEDKQITHRDLAARNVLIDETRTLKISDFGLSRSGIYVNTKTKKVPLRWLSVEAMRDNLYSSKSDVWAFGIVLWEIGTLGGFPYPMISNHELLPFLASGQRLPRPENCSEKLYEIMKQCWAEKSEDRPTFQELVSKLEPQQQKIYIDFDELSSDYVFPPTNADSNPKP